MCTIIRLNSNEILVKSMMKSTENPSISNPYSCLELATPCSVVYQQGLAVHVMSRVQHSFIPPDYFLFNVVPDHLSQQHEHQRKHKQSGKVYYSKLITRFPPILITQILACGWVENSIAHYEQYTCLYLSILPIQQLAYICYTQ